MISVGRVNMQEYANVKMTFILLTFNLNLEKSPFLLAATLVIVNVW